MKTVITIPTIGRTPAYSFDPDNKAQVCTLIRRANVLFRLSARHWEKSNDSKIPADMRANHTAQEMRCAYEGSELLTPLGIQCDWPGLYPSFTGPTGHTFRDTRSAVLDAIGRPRNWIMPEDIY